MKPLLDFTGLPHVAEVKPEYVAPAVDHRLAENRTLGACLPADALD